MQGFPLASITAPPHKLTLKSLLEIYSLRKGRSRYLAHHNYEKSPDTFKQRETKSCAKKKFVIEA